MIIAPHDNGPGPDLPASIETAPPPPGRRTGTHWTVRTLRTGAAVLVAAVVMRIALRHEATPLDPVLPPRQLARLALPTDQLELLDRIEPGVVQPTASGRPTSALYGTVRVDERGRPKFHEGLDIAATRRTRAGRPEDPVYAIADGLVAYANRSAGASSYGIYLILTHEDPVGTVYSLYSHLDSVREDIQPGRRVRRGQPIGRMGNTSTLGIPMSRAHLHLELGMIGNAHFAKQVPSPHGVYNGINLHGIDPLRFFREHRGGEIGSMLDFLRREPVAFRLLLRARGQRPDYFVRYAPLFETTGGTEETLLMAVSEGGVPLHARPATAAESARLSPHPWLVDHVDEATLNRNGRGLIERSTRGWRLSARGEDWLSHLLHAPASRGATRVPVKRLRLPLPEDG